MVPVYNGSQKVLHLASGSECTRKKTGKLTTAASAPAPCSRRAAPLLLASDFARVVARQHELFESDESCEEGGAERREHRRFEEGQAQNEEDLDDAEQSSLYDEYAEEFASMLDDADARGRVDQMLKSMRDAHYAHINRSPLSSQPGRWATLATRHVQRQLELARAAAQLEFKELDDIEEVEQTGEQTGSAAEPPTLAEEGSSVVSSSSVERIQRIERPLAMPSSLPDSFRKLFAVNPPPITWRDYAVRLSKTGCSDDVWVYATALLDRLLHRFADLRLVVANVHRVWLLLMLVACKMNDDYHHTNKHWALVGGLDLQEMNDLERQMLDEWLGWENSLVDERELALYCSALERYNER